MERTVIIGDSCSDLPKEIIEGYNIPFVSLTYNFKGQQYNDDFGCSMAYSDFYQAVRAGEMPTTSQTNIHILTNLFEEYVQKGNSIIYISFSSALSNTFHNAVIARNIVLEEFPEGDITIIDSRSASLGEGLLLYYALEMLNKGATKGDIVDWLENHKLRMNHLFTVEDLDYLKRGGRVSGAAAFVGTVLNIKPVLHVDNQGRLIPLIKVRGRKKSLKVLVEMMEENIIDPEEQTIAISHGDALEDALYLKELILEKFKVKEIIINHVGPVIGAHSGPGTIALFFLGGNREANIKS